MKTTSICIAASAIFAATAAISIADLAWPSDMAAQIAAVEAAARPSGDNAATGTAGAFETFATDEDVSAGIAFSTMPCGTTIIMR